MVHVNSTRSHITCPASFRCGASTVPTVCSPPRMPLRTGGAVLRAVRGGLTPSAGPVETGRAVSAIASTFSYGPRCCDFSSNDRHSTVMLRDVRIAGRLGVQGLCGRRRSPRTLTLKKKKKKKKNLAVCQDLISPRGRPAGHLPSLLRHARSPSTRSNGHCDLGAARLADLRAKHGAVGPRSSPVSVRRRGPDHRDARWGGSPSAQCLARAAATGEGDPLHCSCQHDYPGPHRNRAGGDGWRVADREFPAAPVRRGSSPCGRSDVRADPNQSAQRAVAHSTGSLDQGIAPLRRWRCSPSTPPSRPTASASSSGPSPRRRRTSRPVRAASSSPVGSTSSSSAASRRRVDVRVLPRPQLIQ